jgi:hypothetical protein
MSDRMKVRVARRLWAESGCPATWDDGPQTDKEKFLSLAGAAMEAMRDPMETEYVAANSAALMGSRYSGYSNSGAFWRALIDQEMNNTP